jgi:prepilin-type N-terminal cleavage/methylation domain-containing protein
MRTDRNGLTLIELLIVMVVLGILASIAIAKYTSLKEEAFVATMKADLRNLAIYQANYNIDTQGSYFSGNGSAQGYVASPGVTVLAVTAPGTPPTWSATATHHGIVRACRIITTGTSLWNISCD